MRHWPSSAKTWFGNPKKYENYFEQISQLPNGDIEVFYTDIAGIKSIVKRGVRRPAYYLNGAWGSKQMFGVYAGPNRLTWSWHGFEVDPLKGPIAVQETMAAWRNIAKDDIQTVWSGTGDSRLVGIWLWNPVAFNEEAAIKEINRSIKLGPGTFDALMVYEKNILPLVALFKTYINGWTSEFHLKTLKRQHKLNSDDLIAYWKNYQKAEVALKTIKAIIAKDTKGYKPRSANKIINEMEQALKLFKGKLIRKLKRKNIIPNG